MMKEAFVYMFNDPGYNKKAVVYFVICFVALALMGSPELANVGNSSCSIVQGPKVTPVANPLYFFLPLFGTIFNMILSGYYFTCIQAITKQQNNIVLPYMRYGNSFVKGLKFSIALVLISAVLGLLYVLCSFLGLFAGAVFTVFTILFFGICCNAFMWLYAMEGKMSVFFAWKKVVTFLKENASTYFKNWVLSLLLIIAGAIISTLFMILFNYMFNSPYIAWIVTSIEGAIVASYTAFVGMYLIAKSIKPSDV